MINFLIKFLNPKKKLHPFIQKQNAVYYKNFLAESDFSCIDVQILYCKIYLIIYLT